MSGIKFRDFSQIAKIAKYNSLEKCTAKVDYFELSMLLRKSFPSHPFD